MLAPEDYPDILVTIVHPWETWWCSSEAALG